MNSKGLRSDLFWSGAELVLRYGVQFVTLIVLARFIAPSGFGLMAMAMVVIALGNVLSDSGMTVALTQLPLAADSHFATARRFGLLAGAACLLVALCIAWPLTRIFGQTSLGLLLVAASLALPAVGAATAPDARLIREHRFAERARAQFTASTIGSVLAITLAISGAGTWALVAQLVAAAYVRMLMLERAAPTTGDPSFSDLRTLLPMSGYLVASGMLDALANRLQAVLLGRLFGPTELGYYSQAQNIQQVPTTAFGAVVNKVALPRFSRALRGERLRELASACLQGTWLIFCPGMALAAILAEPLIPVVLGTAWRPMAPVLMVLCIAAALWPIHVVNLLVCTARGDGRAFFRLELIKKLILLGTVAGFGWQGPLPMAYAVGVASLLGAIVNAAYCHGAIGYGPAAQARELAPGLLATAVAAAGALYTGIAVPWHGMAQAIAMVAVFAIIYVLPGLFLGKQALQSWRSAAAGDTVDTTSAALSR